MNMTTRIEEIVAEKINNHRYTVDQKLIDRLDEEFQKPAYRYRANVDALAMEITMRWAGKLKTKDKVPGEQYQWRHDDWIIHAHRITVVDVPSELYTLLQMREDDSQYMPDRRSY